MDSLELKNETPIDKVLKPIENFMKIETLGGIILFVCTIIALFFANSHFSHSIHHFWELEISIGIGHWILSHSLHHWVNDGLMAIFFLVVGLEIKREMLIGELASLKKAILPIAGAIGGMIVPAAIYAAYNWGTPNLRGWGIPMATDIAFALGVVLVLGKRVPLALKIFLLALAIVDDLGAVLVIAIFYTSEISWTALFAGFLIFSTLIAMNKVGIRKISVYFFMGAFLWLALLQSGVHATIAGVLLALTIPTKARIRSEEFEEYSEKFLSKFSKESRKKDCMVSNEEQQKSIHSLEQVCTHVAAPSSVLEYALHPWVAFGIMPIFALANAGVQLGGGDGMSFNNPVTLGIILGLVLGKPIGITAFSFFAVKCGLADKPSGVTWTQFVGVGLLGGIGFTMSIFVGTLAFSDSAMLATAKIGILAASALASIVGSILVVVSHKLQVASLVDENDPGAETTILRTTVS